MRNKKLLWNTTSSLMSQITTIICGFILPRQILASFGSEVNGLVNSITQFLSIITFLELGVGAVVKSSLYKPLAEDDMQSVSKILASAEKFFRKIAKILLCYVIILSVAYPYIAEQNFGYLYTAVLIVAISISSFAQYYFGIVDNLLLTAHQRGYIVYISQTLTVVLNTVFCVVLIHFGSSIHLVKLSTSLIYLLRPLILRTYVNRNYQINRKITYSGEPIQQKWNGMAQHVAAVVLDGTDSIVLTVMATLSDVSIYSVYHLVVHGVKQLFLSMTNGIQALMGELLAKNEIAELKEVFRWTEWVIHTGTVFVFGCTATLIVPFARVYTLGVNDANYVQPLFGLLITVANAGHCLRLPYNMIILAGGHYKQTQTNYIIAALLNIVVSVLTVKIWGLIGVALGTLCAMLYQTVWMAHYISKNLIKWPFVNFIKQTAVDVIIFAASYWLSGMIPMAHISYFSWVVLSIKVAAVWLVITAAVNLIFYRSNVSILIQKISHWKPFGRNIK